MLQLETKNIFFREQTADFHRHKLKEKGASWNTQQRYIKRTDKTKQNSLIRKVNKEKLADPTEFCLLLSYFVLLFFVYYWDCKRFTLRQRAFLFLHKKHQARQTNKKDLSFIVRGRGRRVTVMNVKGKQRCKNMPVRDGLPPSLKFCRHYFLSTFQQRVS